MDEVIRAGFPRRYAPYFFFSLMFHILTSTLSPAARGSILAWSSRWGRKKRLECPKSPMVLFDFPPRTCSYGRLRICAVKTRPKPGTFTHFDRPMRKPLSFWTPSKISSPSQRPFTRRIESISFAGAGCKRRKSAIPWCVRVR